MALKDVNVHPSIFAAIDKVTSQMMSGSLPNDEKGHKAISEHQAVWWKTYGKGCALWSVASLAAMVGILYGLKAMGTPKPFMLFALVVCAAIELVIGYQAYKANKRKLTAEELAAIKPALSLSTAQAAYVDALVALDSAEAIPADQRNEIVKHLNSLLDEEEQLEGHRKWLSDVPPTDLENERDRLRVRAEAATDPVAKAAFTQSLEIAEQRLAAATVQMAAVERLDAQQEMIRQAILSVRESVGRMRGAAGMTAPLDLDGLRQNVSLVHNQARSVEAAIEEVRTLSR
jgi:xanthosine utilization system XapX-like protein